MLLFHNLSFLFLLLFVFQLDTNNSWYMCFFHISVFAGTGQIPHLFIQGSEGNWKQNYTQQPITAKKLLGREREIMS
jgi:hypothetical protein